MHIRKRHINKILLKRAKIFPVLGVLGPRQVGKSTFLMQQWLQEKNANYITFDKKEVVVRATHSPAQLLQDESANQHKHLIIDEAQKVPHIFDSIKALVDQNRRMGAFTLSGSVEFSSKSGVRESLAGRMSITKLYPMTLREINNKKFISPWVSLNFNSKAPAPPRSIETWLERGGMPIFCGLSDFDERISVIHNWVEAICYNDLKQLKHFDCDSEIAYQLMNYLALKPILSFSKLAAELGTTTASIKKHIKALKALFLIYEIPSFKNPHAQSMYYLFDAGVGNAFRAKTQQTLFRGMNFTALLINEIYAQYEYAGKLNPNLYYYRTRGGAEIDLVLETKEKLIGIECKTSVNISSHDLRGLKSFLKNYKHATAYVVAPVQEPYSIEKNIRVIPWNSIG